MFYFHGICDISLEEADVCVLPIPYEATTSYGGGVRFGPQAILEASDYMEYWDEELGRDISEGSKIFTFSPLSCVVSGPEAMLELIRDFLRRHLSRERFFLTLGGEHTITVALLGEYIRLFGSQLGVIQLDAHCDLRDEYEGSSFSHACTMRRVHELGVSIWQFGVRSFSREEYLYFRGSSDIYTFSARQILEGGVEWSSLSLPSYVYLTFDVDVFDSGIFPETGTPEPGGLGWYEVLEIFRRLSVMTRVVGVDIVEFAPRSFHPNPYAYTLARLAYKMIGYFAG